MPMIEQKTLEELGIEMGRLRKEVRELGRLIDAHIANLRPATPRRKPSIDAATTLYFRRSA